MESACLDLLPTEFQPYRHQLAKTLRPYIQITATPGKTRLTQSKFLGLPYLPVGQPYPHDIDGQPMILLAQLNFEEIPPLPDYPEAGILQVFISAHDELYGADLENFDSMQAQTRFQVRYFEKLVHEQDWIYDFEFLRPQLADEELILPAEQECALTFERQTGIVSPSDYQFEHLLGPNFFAPFGIEQNEYEESYWQTFSAQGHRIGGYGFFTQDDPRAKAPAGEDWRILLQIDSDDTAGIMWGDLGVGHFLIPRQHLLRRDFSKILYTWDCG